MKTDLNELAKTVHQANIKWWQNPETGAHIERNPFELLALVISEICECLEGERKGCMDDKLPHRKMAEVELADAKIRLLDFAAGFGFPLYWVSAPPPQGNKGEMLFHIMKKITLIAGPSTLSSFHISQAISMIDDYARIHGYDLDGAFEEKMAYNATREDHTHEARKIAGGKQF